MRIGTAARQGSRLEPAEQHYPAFREALDRRAARAGDARMGLCYIPFTIEDALVRSLADPPATLLVLPNGWIKVAAALPHVCGDLRRQELDEVWDAYRQSWRTAEFTAAAALAVAEPARHAQANVWKQLGVSHERPVRAGGS